MPVINLSSRAIWDSKFGLMLLPPMCGTSLYFVSRLIFFSDIDYTELVNQICCLSFKTLN